MAFTLRALMHVLTGNPSDGGEGMDRGVAGQFGKHLIRTRRVVLVREGGE